MSRTYASDVTSKTDLNEGDEVILTIKGIEDNGWLKCEPVISKGFFYVDPTDYPDMGLEEASTGDYVIVEYQGGTAFSILGLETA